MLLQVHRRGGGDTGPRFDVRHNFTAGYWKHVTRHGVCIGSWQSLYQACSGPVVLAEGNIGFIFAYLAGYLLIAEKIKDKNPWIATMIFVFPAMYFFANGFVVPFELSFGYLIGMPYVNHPITIAIILYVGISFPVQFLTKYGGCEVIAIQNLIYRKNYSSYCVPLLPIDILEKTIVDAIARNRVTRAA